MLDTICFEEVWRVLATHSIRQFPLHFLSRASPCAITFQLDSTIHLLWNLNIPHLATRCICYLRFSEQTGFPPLRINLLFLVTKTQGVYHGQICLYYLHEGQPLQPKYCRPTARLRTHTSGHIQCTAVTDFISNSSLKTNRSGVADSRTRTGHRRNVLRFLAGVKDFFPLSQVSIWLWGHLASSVMCSGDKTDGEWS